MKSWLILMLLAATLAGCAGIDRIVNPNPQPPGVLQGTVSVGPLTPVERVGVPTPTPSPQVYTSRGIDIFKSDGKTLVSSLNFNPDGTYRIELAPGTYVIKLQNFGMGFSKELPKEVRIQNGQTTTLNIDIDTGIR